MQLAYSRVPAYLLVPDGDGPFPAVMALHDHGAHYSIRNYLDYPHIASLACPKAMLFIGGETDKLFPPHSVNEAYAIMHKVWQSQGCDNKLQTHLLPMGHEMPRPVQSSCLNFLNTSLLLHSN